MESGKHLHKTICIRLGMDIVPLCCIAKISNGYFVCIKGNGMIDQNVCDKGVVFQHISITHHPFNIHKFFPICYTKLLVFEHVGAFIHNKFCVISLDYLYEGFCRLILLIQVINQFKTVCMRVENNILQKPADSYRCIDNRLVIYVFFSC